MIAGPDFAIRYPSPACTSCAVSWYEYPLYGFREIGCEVEIDPALDAACGSSGSKFITAIDITHAGKTRRAYLDWSDFDTHFADMIHEHDPPALYYKIQTRQKMTDSGVLPIGQTVSKMRYFDLLDERRQTAEGKPTNDVVAVFRTTARDLRCKAVEIIRAEPWDSIAHVRDYPRREPAPAEIVGNYIPFDQHLQEQAASRVNLALPGVGGDWTWRHTELLGMGAFMLTIEPDHLLPGDSAGAFATCKRDLSDLAVQIEWWLGHDDERRAVAKRGRAYYEESLSPAAMARTMLDGVAA